MKVLKSFYYIPEFVVFYLSKLLQSNFQMAYVILSPKMKINAGFIEYPVKIKSSAGLLLLSNLISMTPGTLSADIDDNKETLLVHMLSNSSPESILHEIDKIERRIIRLIN
jgi:multicomponent Na+:H+ antiporter subunit E